MLLTENNFAPIKAAVEEGRTVYQNLPILSPQVLWLNMINSVMMTVPLAFEAKQSQ